MTLKLNDIADDMVKFFFERTKNHINLVNKYGKKINEDYSNHDADKMDDEDIRVWYAFMTWKKAHSEFEYPFNRSIVDDAAFKHIKHNKHHPEYWDNTIKVFTKTNNGTDNQQTNAENMTVDAIHEMCADWCAMSEELGNNPFEWAKKMINKRWKFTNKQVNEIYKTLDIMWN